MPVALAEPIADVTTTKCSPSAARTEASRANGRLSRGPVSSKGKERSRRSSCKSGLTGAGVVLPPDAAAEVERRQIEYAHVFRPHNAIERELVRQMALGAWRQHELAERICRHEARTNAARLANWEPDEQLRAAEIGRRISDEPETTYLKLQSTSAGCDWLIGRLTLLANGLSNADEGGPGCAWTEADLALVLNLLGRPAELRHLDDWADRLQQLRAEAQSGSDQAVTELRAVIAEEIADLRERSEEAWELIEQPQLNAWASGLAFDLGPEGTKLRRYEAAAFRLFHSAWNRLERLRKDHDIPFIPAREHEPACSSAARSSAPAVPSPPPVMTTRPTVPPAPVAATRQPAPVPAAAHHRTLDLDSSSLGDPMTTVLDFSITGPSLPTVGNGKPVGYKTNPAPGCLANGGPDLGRKNRP